MSDIGKISAPCFPSGKPSDISVIHKVHAWLEFLPIRELVRHFDENNPLHELFIQKRGWDIVHRAQAEGLLKTSYEITDIDIRNPLHRAYLYSYCEQFNAKFGVLRPTDHKTLPIFDFYSRALEKKRKQYLLIAMAAGLEKPASTSAKIYFNIDAPLRAVFYITQCFARHLNTPEFALYNPAESLMKLWNSKTVPELLPLLDQYIATVDEHSAIKAALILFRNDLSELQDMLHASDPKAESALEQYFFIAEKQGVGSKKTTVDTKDDMSISVMARIQKNIRTMVDRITAIPKDNNSQLALHIYSVLQDFSIIDQDADYSDLPDNIQKDIRQATMALIEELGQIYPEETGIDTSIMKEIYEFLVRPPQIIKLVRRLPKRVFDPDKKILVFLQHKQYSKNTPVLVEKTDAPE